MDPNLTNNTGYGNVVSTFQMFNPGSSQMYVDMFSLERYLGNVSDPSKPDYRDEFSQAMLINAELPYILMDGTKGLRYAGEKYTPKMQGEQYDTYWNRVNRTVLNNKFAGTIQKHSDRIFSTPVKIAGESEADIVVYNFFADVTKTGTNCSSFLKKLYEDAKIVGVSFIFIDSPKKIDNETMESQFENRSFFMHLTVKDILGITTEIINGVEKISEFRYVYYEKVYSGFGFKQIKKVRQIKPFQEVIYTQGKSSDGDAVWTQEVIDTDIEEVQLYPYFTKKISSTYAKPPLENLAYLNVQHWNHYSDHSNILHFTQCPILEITGQAAPESISVAAATAFFMRDGGSIKYVEATCTSIKEGADELRNLERQMEEMGNEALMKPVKYETATGVGARQENLVSQLESEATELQMLIDKSFKKLIEISGYKKLIQKTDLGDGWYIEVNRDLGGVSAFSDTKIQYLQSMRDKGDIPWEVYTRRMQEFGVVPQNESLDKMKEKLDLEKEQLEQKVTEKLEQLFKNSKVLKSISLKEEEIDTVTLQNPPKQESKTIV